MSDNSKKRPQADNGETPKKPAGKSTKSRTPATKPTATAGARTESTRPKAEAPSVVENAPARETVRAAGSRAAAKPSGLTGQKLLVVAGLMFAAFFGAYNFASSKATAGAAGVSGGGLLAAAPAGGGCGMSGGGGAGGGGGGCCGGGGAPVEGATTVQGEVQSVDVDTSQGSFSPNVIKAKAGVPIEMNFSQAPGGCLSGVYFPDFNINEDLTAGPKTVKLPALEKGEYSFFCQMQMVSAKIVVE